MFDNKHVSGCSGCSGVKVERLKSKSSIKELEAHTNDTTSF
jgi:hypothetical protein